MTIPPNTTNSSPGSVPGAARSWTGVELRAAREALGLSMVRLAEYLRNPVTGGGPWKHSRVSEAERGLRPVPDWLPEQIAALETARDDLADIMIGTLEEEPAAFLLVHDSDASLWAVHPELEEIRMPAAVHRVAAALAAAEIEADTGRRPQITTV